MAWIDETPAGERHYCKSSGNWGLLNPIIGSFFDSDSYGLPPKLEEMQENIAKLDCILRALYPLSISFQSKMKLFENYT